MKKVVFNRFGDPDVLEIIETEMPPIQPNQILVKVKAVSINPLDWKIRSGQMRLLTGSKFPKGVGIDFAGVVEKAGAQAREFKVGDEVFGGLDGFKGGALAEYLAVDEAQIATKPLGLSFAQAAAMVAVGSAAIKALEELADIKFGTAVLINGATGGVGMFATQIAKRLGATVTAVTNTAGLTVAKDWESDHVVDYKNEDVLTMGRKYDVVFDPSGKLPFSKARRIMKNGSIHIAPVPGPAMVLGWINNLFSNKKSKFLNAPSTPASLEKLARYAADGLDIRISKTYPITAVQAAYSELPKGGLIGKAVFIV